MKPSPRAPIRALLVIAALTLGLGEPIGAAGAVTSGAPAAARTRFEPTYAAWNRLLARYRTPAGVRYGALKADAASLDQVFAELGAVSAEEFRTWPNRAQQAYLINAHNAAALRRVVTHYPTESLEATTWFFRDPRQVADVRLLGRQWSLQSLADRIMGSEFHEARAIFLLNWGARGCAPLPDVAVTSLNLDDLLERQARKTLQNPDYMQFDEKGRIMRLTPLIETYREELQTEFTTIWIFLETYLPTDLAQKIKLRPPRLRYLAFDRALNDAREPAPAPASDDRSTTH